LGVRLMRCEEILCSSRFAAIGISLMK